ncbi:MAG TPA: hypothetical protein VGN07_00685 [Steroidobacteraceae bacterium]
MLLAVSAQPQSATTPMKPCDHDIFRQFDFWVGTWEVKNQAGKILGRNVITTEQQGCVLIEQWQSAGGGTGMSMNYYHPQSGHWKQNWVGGGIILEMSGGLEDGSMVLEGPSREIGQDRQSTLRGTWTVLPDGRVRQHFVESEDQGKTWQEWFDGYYSKVK